MRHESPPEVTGYLVKASRVVVHKKKYFFRLNGSTLSRHRSETSKCTWSKNILSAIVKAHARNGMAIVLKNEHIVLYARNGGDADKWIKAFTAAAQHKIETYYHVKKIIGTGGFASVRLGIDRVDRQKVAIKTISKKGTTSTFLQREIAILKTVDHDNVVETFDIFETNERYHIVMEYMHGGNLFDELNRRKLYCEPHTRRVMEQILNGIGYLHSIGIVHRDLKPENVLLVEPEGLDIKLADFGLSKFYDESSEKLMQTLIGTPQFVAPEVIHNEEYGAEVDIWAAGIIMYNLLTGDLPFSEKEVMKKYESGRFEIPFKPQIWKRFSPEASCLVRQLLCKKVSSRLSADGALQHPWFTKFQFTDSIGLQENLPSLRLRTAVTCIRFLLRLGDRAGISQMVDMPFNALERVESCSSMGSAMSGHSSNLSDWDFQAEDFSITDVFEQDCACSGTRQSSNRSGYDVKRSQVLKELSSKLASVEASGSKCALKGPAHLIPPSTKVRSLSAYDMIDDESGRNEKLFEMEPTIRGVSERPKQYMTKDGMASCPESSACQNSVHKSARGFTPSTSTVEVEDRSGGMGKYNGECDLGQNPGEVSKNTKTPRGVLKAKNWLIDHLGSNLAREKE